jgi:hypothetical protein
VLLIIDRQLHDQLYINQIADQKTTNTNVDAILSNEITRRETIDHYFLFGKFHFPTKCIACAPIAGNHSDGTTIYAATIHAIQVFIVSLFLRVKSVWVTVGSYRCSRATCRASRAISLSRRVKLILCSNE